MKPVLFVAIAILGASTAGAQAAKSAHPPTCARAIKFYDDIKQVPVPHDTVQIPAPDAPVRVTNEAEMEAAELALKTRAATVGATAVLLNTVETDEGNGNVSMRRTTMGLFIRADSAAAQKTCSAK